MPTVPERLGELTATMGDLERRVERMEDELHGGPTVEFQQSVRGRLHSMQSALAAADRMREAAEATVRAQREATHTVEAARGRRWSKGTQAVVIVCAIVTAATPYVLHFVG